MTIIQARNISKQYRFDHISVDALQAVDLEITKGEFVAIKGPSGSGKSTLLHILGCIDRPTAGRVVINGTDTSHLNQKALSKLRLFQIGFVFQQFNLLPTLTAFENVELPMHEAGFSKKERKEKVSHLLKSVGLEMRVHHKPSQLSGGEQQRVAIARALVNDPAIILADEPTGELDSGNAELILNILVSINRDMGQTIVVASHDENVVSQAHRVIKIKDGRISP